jgi:Zn-dependent protease
MELSETVKIIPAAIIGLTIHEFAHAYTAYRLGDNTAKDDGRISLNPLRHIDWMGFFLIIVAGFGWAKPVSFNPDNLKHKHRDEILISIAGPLSNFLLALLLLIVARILFIYPYFNATETGIAVINLIVISGIINFGLFVFNLIPLPPLDGSHVYLTFLKDINPTLMMNLYKWGTAALLGIILLENYGHLNILHLSQIINHITAFFLRLLDFQ